MMMMMVMIVMMKTNIMIHGHDYGGAGDEDNMATCAQFWWQSHSFPWKLMITSDIHIYYMGYYQISTYFIECHQIPIYDYRMPSNMCIFCRMPSANT